MVFDPGHRSYIHIFLNSCLFQLRTGSRSLEALYTTHVAMLIPIQNRLVELRS